MSNESTRYSDLKGPRIFLSKSEPRDLDWIMKLESENNRFVTEYARERHMDILADDNYMHLSVRQHDSEKLVGMALLYGLKDKNKVLEFRRLAVAEKGAGYGREIIRIIKAFCFETLKFHRLWLDVFDDNLRAIGLYESEGFKMEGLLRENTLSDSNYRSLRIYSILENEFNHV